MASITVPELQKVVDRCASRIELRPTYSGRYMYGDTCFGIVCKADGLVQFMLALTSSYPEVAAELAGHAMRTDNMAFDFIYYWPGFEVSE